MSDIKGRFIENDVDLTFKFSPFGTGLKVKVFDNNLEEEIKLNDLQGNAERYYIKQLLHLTKKKIENQLLTTA
jgi:hypothetical protein